MTPVASSAQRDKVVWRSDPVAASNRPAMILLILALIAVAALGVLQTLAPSAGAAVGLAHRDFPTLLIGGGLGVAAALAWMLLRRHLMTRSGAPHRLAVTPDALVIKGTGGVERIPLAEIARHSFKSGLVERCVLELARGGRRTIILDGHSTDTHRHLHRLLELDVRRRDAMPQDPPADESELFPDAAGRAPAPSASAGRSEYRRSFSDRDPPADAASSR